MQLDDELVAQLDRVAEFEGVSRSELLRRAASVLIVAHDELREDLRTIEAYRRLPQDPVLGAALERLAAETLLPW